MMTEGGATDPLVSARAFAGTAMEAIGRGQDAATIRAGGGDDFPEVQVALSVLAAMQQRSRLLERALRYYADPDLWEEGDAPFSLAFYDQGEVARATLAGKDVLTEWE